MCSIKEKIEKEKRDKKEKEKEGKLSMIEKNISFLLH